MTGAVRLRELTLVLLFFCGLEPLHAQSTTEMATVGKLQHDQIWNDALTGLTWAAKDNGKDVSWKSAVNYCRKLKLGGYVDWRLANSFELQGIYDKTTEAPGRAGDTKGGVPRNFTWHVKGNLYLTGDEWSGRVDRDGKPTDYAYYFDFKG